MGKALPVKLLPKPGKATSCEAGGLAICIAVDEGGKIFALGDKCPPVNQPLSFGSVEDGAIADPVLGTKFSLKTGNVVGQWCPSGVGKLLGGLFEPVGVPTYPVKKTGNFVEVQVDVNYKANFEAATGKVFLMPKVNQMENTIKYLLDSRFYINYRGVYAMF